MSVEIDVPILSRPFQRSAFLDLGRAHAASGVVVDQVQGWDQLASCCPPYGAAVISTDSIYVAAVTILEKVSDLVFDRAGAQGA